MRFDQRRERNTPRYKRMRRRFLQENPLCVVCKKEGIVRQADEIDHIIPVRVAPKRMWDVKNIQAICRPHHEDKTAAENRQEADEVPKWKEYMETL